MTALFGCSRADDKALIQAAGRGDVVAIEQLLDRGTNVNTVALDDWTPLTRAASLGMTNAAKVLIIRGAKVNKPNGDLTPLFFAADKGHVAVVRILLESGARLNLPPAVRQNFVRKLKERGDQELINLLSEQLF